MEDSSPVAQSEVLVDFEDSGIKWLKFNALCIDGGGVRGLWALFVLQALMGTIAKREEAHGDFHSFCPRPWPRELESDLTEEERHERRNAADSDEKKLRALRRDRRYLPCHYFDYICGTSTGALIAIMLGRLRMTIVDCISEYEHFGERIFGKPRLLTSKNLLFGSRCTYDHKEAEKVFKDVINRRNDQSPGCRYGNVRFPMSRGPCATFVTTQKSKDKGGSNAPYIIRSYNHEKHTLDSQENTGSPKTITTGLSDTLMSQPKPINRKGTNYEIAQDFDIWQVARAATAADYFFKPMETMDRNTQELFCLTDGGRGLNNPAKLARNEIENLHKRGSTDVIVSVGTAKGNKPKRPGFFSSKIKRDVAKGADELTNSEEVHRYMVERHNETQNSPNRFEYHRLDNPGGLETEFDEWRPRKGKKNGSETKSAIMTDFNAYLNQEGVKREIKDCAAKLVERRQARSHTREWERFATAATYQCCWKGCYLEEFSNDKDLERHIRTKHFESNPSVLRRQVDESRRRWKYRDESGGRSQPR